MDAYAEQCGEARDARRRLNGGDDVSLRDYAVARDKFALDARNGGPPRFAPEVAFPCCVCAHAEHTDSEEPCRTCDHNVNAVKDAAGSGEVTK
jgi:hypothetical protein